MPFLQTPLWDAFGPMGTKTEAFQAVLDGMYSPPTMCDHYATKVLKALACPPIEPIPTHTMDEYTRGWQHAAEKTSSSMSGVYFVHYMSSSVSPTIVVVNAAMAQLPMKHGFTPDQWKHGLNVMLPKQEGNVTVENSTSLSSLKQTSMHTTNGWDELL